MRRTFQATSRTSDHKRPDEDSNNVKRALHNHVFESRNPVPPVSEVHLRKNSEGFDWCVQVNTVTTVQEKRLFGFFNSLKRTSGIAIAKDDATSTRHDFFFNNEDAARIIKALDNVPAPIVKYAMGFEKN